MKALAVALAIGMAAMLGACDREDRHFVKPVSKAHPLAATEGLADLQPGAGGAGMRPTGSAGGYDESSAYALAQGKQWYRWYNCVGCHAQGGGAIGPALMDANWIYGSKPEEIFATIMQGRPNGMPSFRGRIPEAQAWQIVAYVRSLSGLVSKDVAPNRAESLAGAPPESRREPKREDEKKK